MSSIAADFARLQKSMGCLLTLHRVAASATWPNLPNRDFYTDVEFLNRLLAHLIRTGWRVCTLDEVIACLDRGEDGSRLVNFSIDDCYRDTYEMVVPLFRHHEVPVTLFVSTGIPDRTMTMDRAGIETILLESMEAMASGLAVFATRVGGIEDYLVDGVNGYAIEPNGVDIACKLAKALNDDVHLAALREGAVATATIYSWDRVGIASADLLFEVWHEKYGRAQPMSAPS